MKASSDPFRTVCTLPPAPLTMDLSTHVLTLGSCFADGVGTHLYHALPLGHVCVNPYGPVFNPLSIASALNLLMLGAEVIMNEGDDDSAFARFDAARYVFCGNDHLWHSHLHASSFSSATQSDCLRRIRSTLLPAMRLMAQADVVSVTWGTADAWFLKDRPDMVVGNCHKQPATCFQPRRLTIAEIVEQWTAVIDRLNRLRPEAIVLLTVSPYRYAGRGLHASTLTKAVLHLAAEALTQQFAFVHYFPAYEMVMDDLRDYRFYDRDMLHPSAQATAYVFDRLKTWCFSDALLSYSQKKAALLAARAHRPIVGEGEAYAAFQAKLKEKEAAFAQAYAQWEEEPIPLEPVLHGNVH